MESERSDKVSIPMGGMTESEYPCVVTDKMIATWPAALIKAVNDNWGFRMKLRTGEVFKFGSAEPINDEWVHIPIKPDFARDHMRHLSQVFGEVHERGIDIRVSDIVWIVDSEDGWFSRE